MLLDELTLEEKRSFWNIANVLASVDGQIVAEEQSVLAQYVEEMGGGFEFIDPASVDVTAELNAVKGSALRNRRIMYFELFGVAYADTDFSDKEQKILREAADILDIADDVKETLETCVKNVYDSYRKLGDVLNA